MTSTIQGELEESIGLYEVFEALFPCGSITGAPKKITLEILESLEGEPRGVYCGAIGVIQRDKTTFSIPIRTILKTKNQCRFGVGSGIVWDSRAEDEYQELQTKMSFLNQELEFSLVETMLYSPFGEVQEFLEIPKGMAFISHHLKRLQESAKALGFVYPKNLLEKLEELRFDKPKIIRILLERNGDFRIETREYQSISSKTVYLQQKPYTSDLDRFKTTWKKDYSTLDSKGVFDVIYHQNEILLEGSRSNLVLELDGKLYTPKYDGRFLPGVCREVLLERGVIEERVLSVEDLARSQRIFCINSVRGILEVNLL